MEKKEEYSDVKFSGNHWHLVGSMVQSNEGRVYALGNYPPPPDDVLIVAKFRITLKAAA